MHGVMYASVVMYMSAVSWETPPLACQWCDVLRTLDSDLL